MQQVRLPPPVRKGDLVGVAALSSRPEESALEAGIRQLESLGLRVRLADNLGDRWHMFAGDDEARSRSFHDLVGDPEIRAVFFARGGHGVLRILPSINWRLLALNPKAYVGYSDLTPFLLQVVQRLGLVAFHGPMIATDLSEHLGELERQSLMYSLEGRFSMDFDCDSLCGHEPVQGTLLGGCLSLLVSTLGTRYFPSLAGALLFVEDVQEPLYRVDRMLTQLRLSGSLDRVKGMILGYLQPTDEDWDGGTIRALLGHPGDSPPWPLAWGLQSGHGRPNLTLPLGVEARLCPERRCLEILGP